MKRFRILSNSPWFLKGVIALRNTSARNSFSELPRYLSKITISFPSDLDVDMHSYEENYTRTIKVKHTGNVVDVAYLPSKWGRFKYFLSSKAHKKSLIQRIIFELYQMLFVKHVVLGGHLVHASAMSSDAKVILFVGAAGAGKTSAVNCLNERDDFIILNDNLTIINSDRNLVCLSPDYKSEKREEIKINHSTKKITHIIYLERTIKDFYITELDDIETKINWEKSFECSELDYCLQMQTINSIHPSFHQAHLPDAHFIKCFIPDGKIKEGVSLLADQILS
jgi:hypothetical protein